MKKLTYKEALFVEKSFLNLLESNGIMWPYKGYEKVVKIMNREVERAEKRENKIIAKSKKVADTDTILNTLIDIHAALSVGKTAKASSLDFITDKIEEYSAKKEKEVR